MKNNKLMNRILSGILALVMVIGMCPQIAFAAEWVDSVESSLSNFLSFHRVFGVDADVRLPQSLVNQDKEEVPYADTDVVRVSIALNKAATLELFPTADVASNEGAMAYRAQLQKDQETIVARIEEQVLKGETLDVVWNLTLAANIISANVLYGQIDEIAAVRGVKEVFLENQYAPMETEGTTADPMMATSSQMTGSSAAWAAGYTGAGSRIAIIDTGLDTDHQSFNSQAYLYSLEQNAAAKNMSTEDYIASLDLLTAEDIAAVLEDLNIYPFIQYNSGSQNGAYYINEKVPFGINYVDRDFDVTHDNDLQGGHGSHVAGIAAANSYIPTKDGFASAMAEVSMQGVAPDAQLIIMKVFGKDGGAYDADYMVAIEDAIMLGCDTVNLSLGTDKGFARNSNYQDILDSLAKNDVIVAVAAGNSGYWSEYGYSGTGHLYIEDVDFSMIATPAASTNTLAVGSVENAGLTDYYIQVGDQVIFYQYSQFSDYTQLPTLTEVPGDVNYIYIDGIGTAEEVAAVVEAEGGSIAPNTVFVCARGTVNFAEKANNAIGNGFIATIVYNNVDGLLVMNMDGYNYTAPAVSLSLIDGLKLREAAQEVTGDNGVQYFKGTMYISDKVTSVPSDVAYQMSDFSSWGVPGSLQLKPEIVAPGGNIYSVNGEDPSGKSYYNNSGTSMASPQIAGMAALAMQYVKENGLDTKLGVTSRQLATSLLMSTAEPMRNGANYYSILQQGAGLANLANAISSKSFIMMDAAATSGAADGKVKAELGDDPDRTGLYTFSFELNNFGEAAQIFSIDGDFFTQGYYTVNGITYADTATTPLNMAVEYMIEGGYIDASEMYSCDLNGDGVTDAKDAQVILEYAAGNLADIAEMADVSGNGTVSTYDAHLLLASIGSGYFVVQPGDTVTVTVTMEMGESTKEHLNSIYTNGAYVEGYVNVTPLVTEEGEVIPSHSIPVLGFYGNWSDASMYDRANYEDYLYATENGTDFVFPYSGNLNYLTFFDEEDNEITFVGNPYVVEAEFPYHKTAIRPNMEVGDMASSLIRNGAFMFFVMDEEGNVVEAVSDDQVPASYYYQNAQYWMNVNQAGLSIWYTPEELGGFQEGDRFTIGFFAVPEYYETNGALSNDDLLALMASGKIGDGAYHTYSFTVDGTEPELLNVEKREDGDLVITAKDNQYVAAVAVLTASGAQALSISAVDQDEANTVTETVIDMEGVRVNRNCLIMVADYAGNEVFYELTYNDGLADFEGRMYGFTNAKTLGSDNSWLEIDPESLYYDGGDSSIGVDPSMGGTMDVANMDYSIIAAEYVGGYVYMITENNELRVALQGEWENSYLAAMDPAYSKIKDLAFNTTDNKLYALANDNTIYTMDLYTGALEKQYTISITGPELPNEEGVVKSFSEENKKLLTLAIDDEGNFYSINNGDSTWQRVYLYSWSTEDVKGGEISNLTPVNNTYDGLAGEYVYSDDIPATGDPTIQSMAWDHDNDILYWASAVGAVSAYNYLYTFDLNTGKASIVTDGPIIGVADYCLGCLCVNVSGLYIVPKETIDLEVDTIASRLILGRESLTLLQGAQYQMPYDVLPWNLEDKGLNWITSDASVVTVDAAGTITAVGEGVATITATTRSMPHLAASCTVTVNTIQDVALNGMLYNADSNIEWANFNLLDAENWTSNFVTEGYQFLAGGLHRDVLYVHDGNHMYGVDANNFEVTDYGYLHESWLWSDATTGPVTPDGYFDRLVGIINGGMCIGVMDVEAGMGYEIANHRTFSEDPAALIAYIGSTTYFDGMASRYGHEYYIMTEGGELYHDIVYAFYDPDLGVVYADSLTHIGSTGLNLSGMGNPTGPNKGSMYYDIVNDYLIVTAYRSGSESAAVYVFQPDACAPVEVGSFGVDTWPVVSLYSYSALNDLFVTVKPDKAEVYVDETVQLTAKVYLASADHGVTWSSSDETIATVNRNGLVTALKPGTVTITATSNEFNDNRERVTASATITFKPLDSLDLMFHAYVQTEEGGKWVAIDGNTMNFAEMAASDAVYTGALVSDGIIYATDDTYYYAIDPTGNAYTVTQGDNFTNGDGAPFLYMLDGTAAPKQTVELDSYDSVTGQVAGRTNVEVGGTPVYISGFTGDGYYFILLGDYSTGEFLAAPLEADQCPAGVTYYSSRELEGFWFDHYYVLGYDGFLQTYSVYGIAIDGQYNLYDAGWEVDYVPTGLVFEDGDDVSIIYVENDSFTGIVIAHGTEDGIEFYSYDVETRKLGKLGVLEGATDLVGLSLASDLDITVPEMPDPEQPVEPEEVDYLYGYIKTATGYEWVRINPNTQEYETLKQDNTGYPAGGVLNGKIYTVTGVTKYGNTSYSYQQVDPSNDFAMNPNGGDTTYANYTPVDFSGVPSTEVTLVDSTTGATVTKTMGGYMVHISNGKYSSNKPMTFMFTNYRSAETELYTSANAFATKLAGIVYVGSELSADSKEYYDYFLILDQSGNLYDYKLTSCVKDGVVTLNSASVVVTQIGSVELRPAAGASMTRMSENLVYISVNGTVGVELYSYDLAAGTLKALGNVEGAQTLAILYTDAELTGAFEDDEPAEPPVEPECEHSDVNDWEYDENGHWTTCAECGEIVDQGEHAFEEGVCFCGYTDPNYEPECEHSDVSDWEYDENGHWTTCAECGEIVDQGEHAFEEGVCFCGYTDPNYQPEEPECDHTNLGKWKYTSSTHWQICECGEKVNEGEHSYVNGYCIICGKPCEHTNVSEWQHMDEYHWKICVCGEFLEQGTHQFTDGVCVCGYADPTYQPPGDPDQPVDTDAWLHAYVKTASGYAWVMINSKTGEYEILSEDEVEYTGAGIGSDGMIYATDIYATNIYQIDPSNGYEPIPGAKPKYGAAIADVTAAPVQTVTLYDPGTESYVDVEIGATMYVAGDEMFGENYVIFLNDYATSSANVLEMLDVYGKLAVAMTYVSSSVDEAQEYYNVNYIVLFDNGELYNIRVAYSVYNGSVYNNITLSARTTLELDVANGASMALVAENLVYVSVNGANGVELYSLELGTNTVTELSTIAGAETLVGLSLLSEARPDVVPEEPTPEQPEPEQPEQPDPEQPTGAWLHAYVKTASGYAWVKLNPETGEYEILSEDEVEYTGAGVGSDGMIYATDIYATNIYQIDPSNGYEPIPGAKPKYGAAIADVTAAPVQTVTLYDPGTESYVDVEIGATMYVAGDEMFGENYVVFLNDYATSSANVLEMLDVYGKLAVAMTYVSSSVDEAQEYYNVNYIVLFDNGELYNIRVAYSVYNGSVYNNVTLSARTTLELDVANGASMALVAENLVYVSVNGANGVELYSLELGTNTVTELSTIAGAETLVGLSLLSDVQPAAEAQAANQVTGSLMSVTTIRTASNEEQETEDVVISDGQVQFYLTATENVTNGLLEITFDASVLTFQGITCGSALFAVNDSEAAEGKLVIAYASGSAISAGDILASLTFSYEGEYVNTEITVSTAQRNDNDAVSEDAIVVPVSNYVPSGDNTLKDLTVTEGTLSPSFDADVTEYEIEVPYEVENLTVSAVANDEKATVEVSDTTLQVGVNEITVTVTAENGDVRVYTITVTRANRPGDVNGDGVVNTTDAKLVMQFELGLIGEDGLDQNTADVNGDGEINTTDAKLIMQFELGLITEFPNN